MTLKELASALDLQAHGYLSELETGRKLPTVEFVVKAARYFGVATDWLLRDELDVKQSEVVAQSNVIVSDDVFADRAPTPGEIERLRLILSAYQDGSGMLALKGGKTLPGWRDFERTVAVVYGGVAQESKFVFDVIFRSAQQPGTAYGVSCKMRRELNRVDRDGRAAIELSNSAGKFWDHLATIRITHANYKERPAQVGSGLIDLVRQWHRDASTASGGAIDLSRSFYFVLLWNKQGWYQLYQFAIHLPDPITLQWSFPPKERRIIGRDDAGVLFEWYGESGGQLKYYPHASSAVWQSDRFQLEALPAGREHGILDRVAAYFPRQWAAALEE